MNKQEAQEILSMHEECENRKNSCRWFCDVCYYGQYSSIQLAEAKAIMKENNNETNDEIIKDLTEKVFNDELDAEGFLAEYNRIIAEESERMEKSDPVGEREFI